MKVIAIDAGASKTRVLLHDSSKPEQRIERILEPCSYSIDGKKGIKKLAKKIISCYEIKSPPSYHLIAGIAGASTEYSKENISRIFQVFGFHRKRLRIFSDAELLQEATGNNGIVLLVGTGAVCLGRKKNINGHYTEAKAGGYGYRFNSEPGGYSLGTKALNRCLEIEDGILKTKSNLPEKIKYHFKVNSIRELIPSIYESKEIQREIPELSRIIFEYADLNDTLSLRLLTDHVNSLASYIIVVYRKLNFDSTTVYFYGGFFNNKYSKKLLIYPIMNHKNLSKINFKFKILGTKKSDMDPLLESIKILETKV